MPRHRTQPLLRAEGAAPSLAAEARARLRKQRPWWWPGTLPRLRSSFSAQLCGCNGVVRRSIAEQGAALVGIALIELIA